MFCGLRCVLGSLHLVGFVDCRGSLSENGLIVDNGSLLFSGLLPGFGSLNAIGFLLCGGLAYHRLCLSIQWARSFFLGYL
jgi:hypothetical protein